jgi:hypothetical protein
MSVSPQSEGIIFLELFVDSRCFILQSRRWERGGYSGSFSLLPVFPRFLISATRQTHQPVCLFRGVPVACAFDDWLPLLRDSLSSDDGKLELNVICFYCMK